MTKKELFILNYLIAHPKCYGLDIVNASDGLLKKSGSIYVILSRLKTQGLIDSEKIEFPSPQPPRRKYWITEDGELELKALQDTLKPS